MDAAVVERMARAYGQRIHQVLAGVNEQADLGEAIVTGLYACEIHYLMETEFAQTAEDILWRRSKLGLHLSEAERGRVHTWMQEHGVWE